MKKIEGNKNKGLLGREQYERDQKKKKKKLEERIGINNGRI